MTRWTISLIALLVSLSTTELRAANWCVDNTGSATDLSVCSVSPACTDGTLYPDFASMLAAVAASAPAPD